MNRQSRLRGETPTQTLTRHIVFIFYLTFIGLHISLSFYYFEAEGSNYKPYVGFLSYVKNNVETQPIQNIQIVFQDVLNRDNSQSSSIYRWAGSSSGYLCDGVYQSSECNSSTTKSVELMDSNVRNFYYLPGTFTQDGVQITQSATFIITRCPSAGCPAAVFTGTIPTPTQFTIQQDSTSKKYYIYINGSKEIHDFKFYKILLGITTPCMNQDLNSYLPSYLQFPFYKIQSESCDTFGTVPSIISVSQNTATDAKNDALISLDIKQIFIYNEMQITLSDLGKPFTSIPAGSTPTSFKIYVLPKISYSSSITNTQNCVVNDEISLASQYSHNINQTGLGMYIIRQIFMTFLIPIPIVEMIFGFTKNPMVVFVGFASKGLLILNLILLIIEGGIVSSYYSQKENLQNSIRNLGWQGCFDSATNSKFMSFPSLFHSTQDDYNYYAYVYMWIAVVGIFILCLLIAKLVMDMFVKKRKYGEYDSDPIQENQPYDPTIAYIPYQDQQQYFSGEDLQNGQQNILSQQLPVQTSFIKTPSNRQKQVSTEKRNNLSIIKENKYAEGSKMQNVSQKQQNKQQNMEMQDLSNSRQSKSREEDDDDEDD